MGSSSWEAYTVGFSLVGAVIFGAGTGWWLDSRLKTTYWLPILFLVGVAAGFWEMFRTMRRIQSNEAAARRNRESKRVQAPVPSSREETVAPESVGRERIFKVPPPPFLDNEVAKAGEVDADDSEGIEQLIEKLTREKDEEPPPPKTNA